MEADQLKQDRFLNHIASRLGRERKSGVKPPAWADKPYVHLYEGRSKEDLIQQFMDCLDKLNTKVDRVAASDFTQAFLTYLSEVNIQSTLLWDDIRLDQLEIPSMLAANGIDHYKTNQEISDDYKSITAKVELGITVADMGLAETGSVVLFNGGNKGRVASLLPPRFLCILYEKNIVPRLTHAAEEIHNRVGQGLPACINFITGPSRTADIEMDLALGVHGPGKVHVILIRE